MWPYRYSTETTRPGAAVGRGALIGVAVGVLEGVSWLLVSRTASFNSVALSRTQGPNGRRRSGRYHFPPFRRGIGRS
ncbi:hypothetical protein SAMN05216276_101550 [Streptosporangium subroseum]|uniref:Uncharacterized protein n=1 Tax=Streptosporangium subroseum TaxID=106412 RepID=A0A239H1X5_9ACTN|nr:hypothetical protein SAMN05216276_101550 [Streptosporangium subroseum]